MWMSHQQIISGNICMGESKNLINTALIELCSLSMNTFCPSDGQGSIRFQDNISGWETDLEREKCSMYTVNYATWIPSNSPLRYFPFVKRKRVYLPPVASCYFLKCDHTFVLCQHSVQNIMKIHNYWSYYRWENSYRQTVKSIVCMISCMKSELLNVLVFTWMPSSCGFTWAPMLDSSWSSSWVRW